MAGDIHPHPGQVNIGLKFCHWNLNGINARDKIKIPLIEAYNSIFHYDIIALSETIINNSVRDENIYEITPRRKKKYFLSPFIGLPTKVVKSLICFSKTSKILSII